MWDVFLQTFLDRLRVEQAKTGKTSLLHESGGEERS
jgi:hypothetical protein